MGEEKVLGVTKLVNLLLGKPAAALLALLHIHPANSEYPIPNFFAMEIVVFLFAVIFFLWLKARISADRPGATQQAMELLLTNSMGVGIKDLLDDIVGHGSERHIPLFGTIGIFILLSNLAALVPGFMSPTAEKTVPLGCATVVFLYYNWFGIQRHGAGGYAKTLLGPVPAISPIMFVVETVSHFARLLSPHGPALGQHDGQRTDFRLISWAFHRPFFISQPLEPCGVHLRNRASCDSAGAVGVSHF